MNRRPFRSIVRSSYTAVVVLLVAGIGLSVGEAHGQTRLLLTPSSGATKAGNGSVSLKAVAGQPFTGTSTDGEAALGTGAWNQIAGVVRRPAVVAMPDTASTREDEPVAIEVLLNDQTPGEEAPTLAGFTQPQHGNVAADEGSAALVYTPNPDFHGIDAFTYTIRVAAGDSATARVDVTVAPVNDPPVWAPAADTTVAVGVVLAYELQATDVDGDSLALFAVQMPEWLTLEGGAGGLVVVAGIASDADEGSHEVVVGASDGVESVTATFTVLVTRNAPAAPVAVAPENGAMGLTPPIDLTWEAPASATAFHVQVAADSGFTHIEIDTAGVVEPSLRVAELEAAVDYFWRVRAGNEAGYGAWSGVMRFRTASFVSAEDASSPDRFALLPNFPNPFNTSTRIEFSLPGPAHVQVDVFDLLGRRIADLLREDRPAGYFFVVFDASHLPAGTYVVRLQAGGSVATRKIILLK